MPLPTTTPVPVPMPETFSLGVLLTLLAILLVSLGVFFGLVRRWTVGSRAWAMRQWARRAGFRAARGTFPPIVSPVIAHAPEDGEQYVSETTTVLRLHSAGGGSWNVLVRRLETPWPTTGVRPVANVSSVLDLYSLASFPSLTTGERFVVYGTDGPAARSLAGSSMRALLPADIGVLLADRDMMLDFTSRPFDEIEISRMVALADQLVAHLPAVRRG